MIAGFRNVILLSSLVVPIPNRPIILGKCPIRRLHRAVSVKVEGNRLSMNASPHSAVRKLALMAQAPLPWYWPVLLISLCVACAGSPASEQPENELGAAGASPTSDPSWCEMQAILQAKCQRCHDSPLAHGAPFPLLTYSDTQARDKKGHARFEQMANAIDTDYMPPQFIDLDPPVAPLSAGERALLLAWCAQGAPLTGSATCSPEP
jgi:uncharacterized membrane protein